VRHRETAAGPLPGKLSEQLQCLLPGRADHDNADIEAMSRLWRYLMRYRVRYLGGSPAWLPPPLSAWRCHGSSSAAWTRSLRTRAAGCSVLPDV